MKKFNTIIPILMERDGLSKEEATERVEEVSEMIADADPWDIEDILADELGLEMDYIFDILM